MKMHNMTEDAQYLLLTVYKQANPDKLALFYPVTTKLGDKYNYYLKPNTDNLSVDLVKCCVNGLSPEKMKKFQTSISTLHLTQLK